MNRKFYVFGSALLLLNYSYCLGQATFTRITTGQIATDAAHSFGCAWGDYDKDGHLDLFVGNALGDANALYRNNGNGTFTRITTGDLPATIGDSTGVAWADYDNDGDLDLFVVNWQIPSFLFQNNGDGTFARVVNGTIGSNAANANGCAWGDYDRDGFVDLVVGIAGGSRNEFLYHNRGDGTFLQITSGPVVQSGGDSGVLAWGDYDGDGAPDLFVSNLGSAANRNDFLFRNDGSGSFTRISSGPVVNDTIVSAGCAWGDYDNDGDLDLFVAAGDGVAANRLYQNQGDGTFDLISVGAIASATGLAQSCDWADYDNDGWLDLFIANDRGQNNVLFHNNGNGTFTRVMSGSIVSDGGYSIGCAWGDYNNDGFLDLFVSNGGDQIAEAGFLYRNDGNTNRWIRLKCIGGASNRSAIGTKVRVKATIGGVSRWQLREITTGGGGNGSAIDPHFGLGGATNIETIRIEWLSGTVQELRNVAVNQILTVQEPPVLAISRSNTLGQPFTLTLKGGRGMPYTIESSTNLVHWSRLTNFTAINLTSVIRDSAASNSPARFYRASRAD